MGVLNDGSTVLVEVNDGFALGDYGLGTLLYVDLLKARWDSIVSGRAPYI